jgi:signal transduction histidine kinase
LTGGSWWPRDPSTLAWALLFVQVVACLSLAVQSRAPLTVVALLGGFTLAVTLLVSPGHVLTPIHDDAVWAPYAVILAAYAPVIGASSPWRAFVAIKGLPARRPTWVGFAAVAALAVVSARPWQPSAEVITIGVIRTALGPLLALYLDARRRLVRAVAEQARMDERAELAGEMHDLVTRHVTLMVMQAGALRVATADSEVARVAEELRVTGRRALDELRDLVGVLRAGPGSRPLGTPLELAAESRDAGTPVTLEERGDPALVAPVVDRTLRRVVQEGLTNVRKHAPGSATTVAIRYEPARVHVAVRNAAPSRTPDAALVASGSGVGIADLRRRVELVGGALHAGVLPDGGFELAAELPAYVPTGVAA